MLLLGGTLSLGAHCRRRRKKSPQDQDFQGPKVTKALVWAPFLDI